MKKVSLRDASVTPFKQLSRGLSTWLQELKVGSYLEEGLNKNKMEIRALKMICTKSKHGLLLGIL
jgi:hypothetical protein